MKMFVLDGKTSEQPWKRNNLIPAYISLNTSPIGERTFHWKRKLFPLLVGEFAAERTIILGEIFECSLFVLILSY